MARARHLARLARALFRGQLFEHGQLAALLLERRGRLFTYLFFLGTVKYITQMV